MAIDIEAAIPHRAPFLLIDKVIEASGDAIVAETTLRQDDELWARIYAGHYPGNPITPGVLLLEMLFQAAGVLISRRLGDETPAGVPVVTRIHNVKFKHMVRPGDTVRLEATLTECMSNVFFLKGMVKNGGATAVQAVFALALTEAK